MSVILSIYSERAYKEFVLPPIQNAETTLSIRRDVFGLPMEVELRLENTDDVWSFSEENCVQLRCEEANAVGQPLRDGTYISCSLQGKMILAIMVSISERRFSAYGKFRLAGQSASVGKEMDCALQYSFTSQNHQYISGQHIVIFQRGNGLVLRDKSRNGVFVNDIRIRGEVPLKYGDRVDIWGLSFVALGQTLAIRPHENLRIDPSQLVLCGDEAAPAPLETSSKLSYHRSPRSGGWLYQEEVSIEPPPAPQQTAEQPLFMVVGPALTMALPMLIGSGMAVIGAQGNSAFMYTGIVTAVLSAVIGAMWAVINLRYSKSQAKKAEVHRFSAYSDYLVRITEDIRKQYEHNTSVLRQTYPSASTCVASGIGHLWERNIHHADFLRYRLGLGDQPFQVEIKVPSERFDLIDDSLKTKPAMIRENFRTLHDVPVCIDLREERVVGLVGGPDRAGAREILYALVAQIAAQNCYTDVKLAFSYREDQGDDASNWAFCRCLPHTWSEGRKVRYVAASKPEASDMFYELMGVLRLRGEVDHTNPDAPLPKPWYIVVIEDSAILENEPIAKFLLDAKHDYGFTTLLLADRAKDLPNNCECVIANKNGSFTLYHTRESEEDVGLIRPDFVSRKDLERFARSLSNIEVDEIEVGGEIPNAVTFFDMYGIERPEELHVEERWKRSRTYENMRALIGLKSGAQPCYLDVHEKYHGPHGLVAGTTGSGKSETLQTYILSLALNFSPYDVGLFIIDYKGGGMANLFDGLPHMLGQISNLSGNQVHRAMVSIKSENLRRQRIFNENGVNNINLYTTLYKNGEATVPVPHLLIIIDEFAELKREQPEFMRELISVAQVGRSLGVHLILATQKPSGTVDDNIWSNSKFRLCLRVQDRQDSMDMLHKPDAAYLTQAGRGFLQVGSDEVYEQFQSGWSGAPYDEDAVGNKQVLAKMLGNTGKTALVGNYAKRQRKEQRLAAWLESLLSCLEQVWKDQPELRTEQGNETPLYDALYALFAEREISYGDSEYNRRLLGNLIRLARQSKGQPRPLAWIMEQAASQRVKLPEQKEKTQLDAMVGYLADMAQKLDYRPLQPLWLDPLPKTLTLREVEGWEDSGFHHGAWPAYGNKWELSAIIGRGDDPANQAQFPVEVNFSQGGNYGLLGAAGTGKSTFVQTLVYSLIHRYSPQYLNIYVLDFSNHACATFDGEAHIGGILSENDLDRVGKLFYLLRRMVEERKRAFQGGSYAQYVMVHGPEYPVVVVAIDGIANFREKTEEQYDEELVRLAREGAGFGLYFFITGANFGITEIFSRLGDNLRTTLTLELSDIYQYSDALRCLQPSLTPETGVPGRGLTEVNGAILEYQTALALDGEDDYTRLSNIREKCRLLNAAWDGPAARKVPFIPENSVWTDLTAREDFAAALADPKALPLGYVSSTAEIYSLDLSRMFCYTVAGRRRGGKTNVLRLLMRSAAAKGARIAVLETNGSSLKNEASALQGDYYTSLEEIVGFVGELAPVFKARHGIKQELAAQGLEEDAQYQRMCQEETWLVVISDLAAFMELVYSSAGRERNLNGALENLIGKGYLHQIFFAAAIDTEDKARASGEGKLYDFFTREQNGVLLGGNAASQQIFDFSGMPFRDQGTPEKPGVGLVPPKNGEPYERVILPLARG